MTDNNSSDTGFFDGFGTDEIVAAVATDEQPLSSDTAEPMGLTPIGEEETEETAEENSDTDIEGEEENSNTDAEGEEDNSDADADEEGKSEGNEVKALNEEEVKKAETAIAKTKKDEEEEEDENKLYPVIDDSYNNLEACQVNVTYSLLPIKSESTNPGEREVLVTVYDHDDPPFIRECRLNDLGELPKIAQEMMAELAKTLPSRAEARAKEKQEEKDEREKRKARLAKSHTKTPVKPAAKTPAKTPATKEPAGQIDLFGDLMGK
jgi:hypothetical protein